MSKAKDCQGNEQVLRWNKSGKRGPVGKAGAAGQPGDNGIPGQDGATLLSGSGVPDPGLGADGDYYVDSVGAQLYGPKSDGSWPEEAASVRGPQGPAGTPGADGLNGQAGPQGNDGGTGPVGPAGGQGTTGSAGSDGTDGNTILNGAGAPGSDDGADGDFYLDTTAFELYGPKATNLWPTGVSIRGPKGDQGTPGATGATGAAGPDGATGAAGTGTGTAYTSSSGPPGTVTTSF